MRPIVKHLRAQGVRLVLYLDDSIVSVKNSLTEALAVSTLVHKSLSDRRWISDK